METGLFSAVKLHKYSLYVNKKDTNGNILCSLTTTTTTTMYLFKEI